jgi:hypothetical protein
MCSPALIGAATLAMVVVVATAPGYPQETPAAHPSAALIESFDECIQDRFRDLSGKWLGLARVTPASPHAFFAHNVREESAVQYLEAARLNVVMYVGGRKLLGEDGYSITPQRGAFVMVPGRNGARLEGPIVVTPLSYHAPPQNAPRTATLMADAATAFRAFDRIDQTSFSVEGWNVAARPVRASSKTCLGCHRLAPAGKSENALRMGDALGVVLYAYQERPS